MTNQTKYLLTIAALTLSLQACAPKVYVVDSPEPSEYDYVTGDAQQASTLSIVDAREDSFMPFTSGVLPMGLTHEGEPIKPIRFLAEFTVAELAARGIPVRAGTDDAVEIQINKVAMRNYRATAFSPFMTTTVLSADVMAPEGERRVGAFIVRGKVPVWSFDEIIEPTMNQPLELLVQEFAAKINVILFQQSADDATIETLVHAVNSDPNRGEAYLDVYQLGFSNNTTAISPLVEMTESPHEYIRVAAISSLGTIGAHGQVDHLVSIFLGDSSWRDRAMAVKSLADLAVTGNDKAMAFLENDVQAGLAGETAAGADWTREILGLYLRK